MKISSQFYLRFWLMIILIIIVGSLAVFQAHLLIKLSSQLHNHPLTVNHILRDIHLNLVKMQSQMKELSFVKSSADSEAVRQALTSFEKKIYQSFEMIKNNSVSDERLDIDYIIKLFEKWKPIRDEIMTLHKNERVNQVNSLVFTGKNAQQVAQIEESLKKWLESTNSQTDEFINTTKPQSLHSLFIAIGIATLMLIGIWMMLTISRQIGNQVSLALQMANAMADGQLTEHLQCDALTKTGQLVQALETTQSRLNKSRQELEQMQTQLRLLEEQKRQLVQGKCSPENLRHNANMDKVFTSFVEEDIV